MTVGCWGDNVGLLEVSLAISHPPTAKDRGVLVPLLPVTAAGWMVVPGALRSLHLTSTKETGLPAASAPACWGPVNPEQMRASCCSSQRLWSAEDLPVPRSCVHTSWKCKAVGFTAYWKRTLYVSFLPQPLINGSSASQDRWLICISGHLQGPPGHVWGFILPNHRHRGWKESGADPGLRLPSAWPGRSQLSLQMG